MAVEICFTEKESITLGYAMARAQKDHFNSSGCDDPCSN